MSQSVVLFTKLYDDVAGSSWSRNRTFMEKSERGRLWKDVSATTGATTFLMLLLAADLGFVLLHPLHIADLLDFPQLSLGKEGGYAETFQYIKEFWIVVLLIIVLIKTRLIGYAIWAFLFLYLLLDDALQIHETLGGYIVTRLGFAPSLGLRAQDFGELAVSAGVATAFLFALILPYLHSTVAFKQVTRHLLLLLFTLAFFGIIVDMLHIVFRQWKYIEALSGIVEDGGEMVVMSSIAWYVFLLNARSGAVGFARSSPQ